MDHLLIFNAIVTFVEAAGVFFLTVTETNGVRRFSLIVAVWILYNALVYMVALLGFIAPADIGPIWLRPTQSIPGLLILCILYLHWHPTPTRKG